MAAAVFGFVGVLVGAVIAGGVSLRIAKQTREAAERAWVRDNRREIYDRFLTCSQTLLNACEDADKSKTKEARNWIGSALLFFFPLARGSVGVYLRVRLGRGVVRRCPMRPAFVMMRPGCVLRTRG